MNHSEEFTRKSNPGLYEQGDSIRFDGLAGTILVIDRLKRQFGIATDEAPSRFLVVPMVSSHLIDKWQTA